MLKLAVIGLIFLAGLYFVTFPEGVEGFSNKVPYSCPNILIQKGADFYLYNSKLANVPGVNPLQFKSLEDYVEFTDWQRSQGIRCPVLYLQEVYDAQGNPVYKARPSPMNLSGGSIEAPAGVVPPVTKLYDAGRDDPPYNKNSYPAYDPMDQYIGLNTPLDKMFHENTGVSANPMDANWGGQTFTQELVDGGYYQGDEVSIAPA
jgi:hypothetical protein